MSARGDRLLGQAVIKRTISGKVETSNPPITGSKYFVDDIVCELRNQRHNVIAVAPFARPADQLSFAEQDVRPKIGSASGLLQQRTHAC